MGSISLRDVGVVASTPLFTNLSLVIGESDRVGLVAANGAGKTTLLKCLAGLFAPPRFLVKNAAVRPLASFAAAAS